MHALVQKWYITTRYYISYTKNDLVQCPVAFLKFLRTILHRFLNTSDVIPIFKKKIKKKIGFLHRAVILHRFPRLTDVVRIIFLSRGFPLISPFRLRAFFILFAFSSLFVPNHHTTPQQHRTATAPHQHRTATAPHQHSTATAPHQHRTATAQHRRFSSRGRSSMQQLLRAGAPHQHRTATAQHRKFSSRGRSSTQPLLRAGVEQALLRAATPLLRAHPLRAAALRSTQLLLHLRESCHHSRSRSPLFEQRRRCFGVPPPLVIGFTCVVIVLFVLLLCVIF